MGLALTVEQFHDLADRLKSAGVTFIIEPHLRFEGMPGEQYTMFFKDPSGSYSKSSATANGTISTSLCSSLFFTGNNLEFKAMTHPENLFAKYNVKDE